VQGKGGENVSLIVRAKKNQRLKNEASLSKARIHEYSGGRISVFCIWEFKKRLRKESHQHQYGERRDRSLWGKVVNSRSLHSQNSLATGSSVKI